MAGLCKAMIVGNLGADPEKRFTQDGRPVTRFRVAVNNSKRDRDGNWTEHTEWFGVTAFGRQAEFAAERLTKGSRVYVDGRLESRTWDGPDGKRFFLDIVANEVISLDSRARDDDGFQPQGREGGGDDFAPTPMGAGGGERQPTRYGGRPPAEEPADLEDLPF